MLHFTNLVKPIDLAYFKLWSDRNNNALLGLLRAADAPAGPLAHITVLLTFNIPGSLIKIWQYFLSCGERACQIFTKLPGSGSQSRLLFGGLVLLVHMTISALLNVSETPSMNLPHRWLPIRLLSPILPLISRLLIFVSPLILSWWDWCLGWGSSCF